MIEREKYVCKQKMLRQDLGDETYDEVYDDKPQDGLIFIYLIQIFQ